NPFPGTLALRVEALEAGAGVEFETAIDGRTAPLYLFKTGVSFAEHMEQFVREALRKGLCGWEVTDCLVTVTEIGYAGADGAPSKRGPLATSADYRKLTSLVLRRALEVAGTVVCEPIHRFHVGVPADTLGAVLPALARLDALPEAPSIRGTWATVEGDVRAARMN